MKRLRDTRIKMKPRGRPMPENLAKPWKPGQSGNPAGRPSAGLSVREWMNCLQNCTRAELREMLKDETQPATKLAAVRTWLDATCADRTRGGQPIAGPELDRICDQTAGKPQQQVEHAGVTSIEVVYRKPIENPDD